MGRHSGEVAEGEPVDEPDADDQPRERHLGGKMRGRNCKKSCKAKRRGSVGNLCHPIGGKKEDTETARKYGHQDPIPEKEENIKVILVYLTLS